MVEGGQRIQGQVRSRESTIAILNKIVREDLFEKMTV